jgi:hypothetical protein
VKSIYGRYAEEKGLERVTGLHNTCAREIFQAN